jgi:hypothetical protein
MEFYIVFIQLDAVLDENTQIKIPPIPLLVLQGFSRTLSNAKDQAIALRAQGFKVVVGGPIPIAFELT